MKIARTLFFYVVLIFSIIFLGLICMASAFINPAWPHRIAGFWGRLNIWAAGVKVRVDGAENLDPAQPYVFAANHQGWFDIFAILGYLPVPFSWLAKEELFKIPILGRAMKASGYISIDRGDRRKALASMTEAAVKIKNGTSVFIFPEGTRSADGLVRGFKKGGFILGIKSQQPIVPVSISGSYLILPKTSLVINPGGRIHITIGKPIATDGMDMKSRDPLLARVRQAILEHLTPQEAGPPDKADPKAAYSTGGINPQNV